MWASWFFVFWDSLGNVKIWHWLKTSNAQDSTLKLQISLFFSFSSLSSPPVTFFILGTADHPLYMVVRPISRVTPRKSNQVCIGIRFVWACDVIATINDSDYFGNKRSTTVSTVCFLSGILYICFQLTFRSECIAPFYSMVLDLQLVERGEGRGSGTQRPWSRRKAQSRVNKVADSTPLRTQTTRFW